jgi:hypothetical protein
VNIATVPGVWLVSSLLLVAPAAAQSVPSDPPSPADLLSGTAASAFGAHA